MNIVHAHFIVGAEAFSQDRVKAETSDSRQFLDPDWLSKNYFE